MSSPTATEAPAPVSDARVESPDRPSQEELEQQPEEHQAEQQPEAQPDEDEAQNDAPSPSPSSSHSEGEYSGSEAGPDPADDDAPHPLPNEPLPSDGPPLPNEPLPTNPSAPPLPAEPLPEPEDDGWEFHWNPNDQSYWFYNRFTGAWQKENPRVPTAGDTTTTATASTTTTTAPTDPPPPTTTTLSNPASISGGYNPAIHGSYDENAWYAQALRPPATTTLPPTETTPEDYTSTGFFNRLTGQWQAPEQGTERHSDEAKSRRQMRAFFDVDAAANMHDGRSLKAERSGIKPSKAELKVFKERRRAKKEEKRRAWLRD